MPIVLSREEFEKLRKVIDKRKSHKTPFNDMRPYTKRYCFLRYKIRGRQRAKRIEVREDFFEAVWPWHMSEIAEYKTSKILKKSRGPIFVFALDDPSHLEPLFRAMLEYLEADDSKSVEYYWEKDIGR